MFLCVICWQEAENAPAHMASHGYTRPQGTITSKWVYAVIKDATQWVRDVDDLIQYLRLDHVEAKIIREAVTEPFILQAQFKRIYLSNKTEIVWVWHRGQVRIAHVGIPWLKLHYYKSPVGDTFVDGDLCHWRVADLTGVSYNAQFARLNMFTALNQKYGSYYPEYAQIKLALFATLPQPIAEEIDAIVAQTFAMDIILHDYATDSYIADRLREISPHVKFRLPRDIPGGVARTEWEKIAAALTREKAAQ